MTVVRLAIGAVSLASDEVGRRLRAVPQDPEARLEPGPAQRAHGPLVLGDVAAGVAVESAELVGRLISNVARGGRRAVGGAGTLPVVSTALQNLSDRGRTEERLGRRMVERLIRDTTVSSVADIAQFAVTEVTHSPEVAALVRSQSAGIATDAILEVRANSEQADDRLERRIHSWLHLRNGSPRPGA